MSVDTVVKLWSLKSDSLEWFNTPFPAHSVDEAKSAIRSNVMSGRDQYLATCLDDFSLVCVGSFNGKVGFFENIDSEPIPLNTFISLKTKDKS